MKAAAAWKSAALSDAGLRRQKNEDRVYADDDAGVFLVVDGLGGHPAGERAAEVAVEVIAREVAAERGDVEARVRHAIAAANNEIYALAQSDPECSGMACVLTLAVTKGDHVTVGHVGDSRLYLAWNGVVRKLTPDHSPVGEWEDNGELTSAEAMLHPRRNEVFRDVGSRERTPDEDGFIETRRFPFHPAAALLLCSDGLSDLLTTAEIGDVIEQYDGDAQAIAARLIAAANERGGTDNVSVVFVAGPDFVGMRSPACEDARTRHAITRSRRGAGRWRGVWVRAIWLVIGIVIGIALREVWKR
jgi:serine/threonine protein phosphatase PrpC